MKFTAREVLPYTCDSDIDTEEDYVTDTTLYLTDGWFRWSLCLFCVVFMPPQSDGI